MEEEPIVGDTVKAYGAITGTGLIVGAPIPHFSMRQTKIYMIRIKGRIISYTYEHIFPFVPHVLVEKTLREITNIEG